MWLIDTTSLSLEYKYFSEDDIHQPRYAILSHMWDDEEVSFQEFRDDSSRHKKGYEKILKTCTQAKEDGLQYAWVDTCCINKESSAELSEAINSMWRWYRDAQVCYAYLSDVHSSGVVLNDTDWRSHFRAKDNDYDGRTSYSSLKNSGDVDAWTTSSVNEHDARTPYAKFMSSRWFRRGWTLQELLAPSRIVFYDQNWHRIGSKPYMTRLLSDCTGIDEPALQSLRNIDNYCVARKMYWATARMTSRVEDRAYSLLGVFAVNLPLLYGEGRNAFVRLQEEIVRTSTDQSVFAWEAAPAGDATAVFALSPDCFSRGRNIVSWPQDTTSYRVTNRGITFDKIQIAPAGEQVPDDEAEKDAQYHIILNCKLERDLRGPLSLHAFRAKTTQDYVLSRTRLQVCENYHTSEKDFRSLTILKESPPSLLLSSSSSYPIPKATRVMSPPTLADIKGSTRIQLLQDRRWSNRVYMLFSAPAALHGTIEDYWKAALADFRVVILDRTYDGDHQKVLRNHKPTLTASRIGIDGTLWTANVKIEEVMGDFVYVIEITAQSLIQAEIPS